MSLKHNRLRSVLRRELAEIKLRNPSFSLRAFARRLGLSVSMLSSYLSGDRDLSDEKALAVCRSLSLSFEEFERLTKSFACQTAGTRLLSNAERSFVSDLLTVRLHTLKNDCYFKSDVAWMAQRLGANEKSVQRSIKILKELSLWETDSEETLQTNEENLDDLRGSVRIAQKNRLRDIEASFDDVPSDQRDVRSLTLGFSPGSHAAYQKLATKFMADVMALADSHPKTEVYEICLYMFPVTKPLK